MRAGEQTRSSGSTFGMSTECDTSAFGLVPRVQRQSRPPEIRLVGLLIRSALGGGREHEPHTPCSAGFLHFAGRAAAAASAPNSASSSLPPSLPPSRASFSGQGCYQPVYSGTHDAWHEMAWLGLLEALSLPAQYPDGESCHPPATPPPGARYRGGVQPAVPTNR